MNEKYVELSSNQLAENSDVAKPIDLLESSAITIDYFYLPKKEGIGNLNYIVDGEGNAFYLIKKSGLPDNIKKQLKGGDAGAGTYADYFNLNDVYGVTSDLQVYYCSNGKTSIKGTSVGNLDTDNPGREIYSETSSPSSYDLLNTYDTNGDGKLTATELLSITELYIKETDALPNFGEFYNLPNLTKLIIENKSGGSLNGIQNATRLDFIDLRGCTFTDYKAIGNLKNLSSFHLYRIDDVELEKICSKTTGIGDAKLTNLKDLAIIGFFNNGLEVFPETNVPWTDSNRDSSKTSNYKSDRTITSLLPLKNLSLDTSNSVNRLSVFYNKLTSLDGLQEFKNLTFLCALGNYIEDASAIADLTKISLLYLNGNNLNSLPAFAEDSQLSTIYVDYNSELTSLAGLENCQKLNTILANNSNILDISAIKNLKNITSINLRKNVNLKDVSSIASTSTITKAKLSFISLLDVLNIENISEIKSEINKASNSKIPPIYALSLLADDSTLLDLQNESIKINIFKDLKQYKDLTKVRLQNITLLDDSGAAITDSATINEAFGVASSGWKNLQYLSLYNNQKLTDVSFIKANGLTKLIELDLRYTLITSVDFLEEMTKSTTNRLSLRTLALYSYNNTTKTLINVSLKNIPLTVSNLSGSCYWTYLPNAVVGGLAVPNSYINTLNGTNITNLRVPYLRWVDVAIDLSSCTSLNSITTHYGLGNISIPPSVTYFYSWGVSDFSFPKGKPSLTYYYVHGPSGEVIEQLNKFASIDTFAMGWGYGSSNTPQIVNCTTIKHFSVISGTNGYAPFEIKVPPQLMSFSLSDGYGVPLSGISCPGDTTSSLQSISIQNANITSCSLSDFPNLTVASLRGCKISNIDFAENNSITSLDLLSNTLNNLHNFSKLKKATTINISYNQTLSDFSDYEGTRENNIDIIASLNPKSSIATSDTCKLVNFYATGCIGVLNWNRLSSSPYVWTRLEY